MKKKRDTAVGLIIALSVIFLLLIGTGLVLGSCYIGDKLMDSGKAMATDIALLVKNNFRITDAEVAYMKTLTFNEMEVDPINRRLMDVGDGVKLNAAVNNVYVVAPLKEDEYRRCPDQETADFLGFALDEPLDGIWLLNGKIGPDGKFEVAQREDIFRYTVLDENQRCGMERREAFGTFSKDAWGDFITGYAPIYTTEGSFVGLLGIDMSPDSYQSSARHMSVLIAVMCACIAAMLSGLYITVYIKYVKAREGQRRFEFFSGMSHVMRTPMNGILGMAALSRTEKDPEVLRRNFETVESSGKYLLELINQTLNYKNDGEPPKEDPKPPASLKEEWARPELVGKRILLCEDHPINAEITRRMVERVGCEIDVAPDGKRGLELFTDSAEGWYDAILMDIRMPVMDGLEAARRIRGLNRGDAKTVPIIALTANSYLEDRSATEAVGMNAHLTKPVEPALLFQTLAEAISQDRRTKDEEGRQL